jgi:hypothetical protein
LKGGLRWHARLCREARLSLAEASIALAGLGALGAGRFESGAHALLAVLDGHGLDEAGRTIEAWLGERSAA